MLHQPLTVSLLYWTVPVQITPFLSSRQKEAGTMAYMAPECFDSKGSVGERSDIYALGIILWECMTGQKPWGDYHNQFAVVYEVAHNDGRHPLPDPGDNDAAKVLNDIITWCWARNPKERPGSGDLLKIFAGMLRVFVGVPDEGVAPLDESEELSGMMEHARAYIGLNSAIYFMDDMLFSSAQLADIRPVAYATYYTTHDVFMFAHRLFI
eukprot:jgi/Chrzof1/5082/Cz15g10320.t1